jgi:hypothetical protein
VEQLTAHNADCKMICKTHSLFYWQEHAFFNNFNGWGARIRTWEWRNQNQPDYPIIVRRIWKKRSKQALAIPIAWQPFPNEKQASQAGINLLLYRAAEHAIIDEALGTHVCRPPR